MFIYEVSYYIRHGVAPMVCATTSNNLRELQAK